MKIKTGKRKVSVNNPKPPNLEELSDTLWFPNATHFLFFE